MLSLLDHTKRNYNPEELSKEDNDNVKIEEGVNTEEYVTIEENVKTEDNLEEELEQKFDEAKMIDTNEDLKVENVGDDCDTDVEERQGVKRKYCLWSWY